MTTFTEKSKRSDKSEKIHVAPSLQDVLTVAQREQTATFKQVFKTWRRHRRERSMRTGLGAR